LAEPVDRSARIVVVDGGGEARPALGSRFHDVTMVNLNRNHCPAAPAPAVRPSCSSCSSCSSCPVCPSVPQDSAAAHGRSARGSIEGMGSAARLVGPGVLLGSIVCLSRGCTSHGTGGGPPAPASCAVAPAPPSQDDFCLAIASYDGRCGH